MALSSARVQAVRSQTEAGLFRSSQDKTEQARQKTALETKRTGCNEKKDYPLVAPRNKNG